MSCNLFQEISIFNPVYITSKNCFTINHIQDLVCIPKTTRPSLYLILLNRDSILDTHGVYFSKMIPLSIPCYPQTVLTGQGFLKLQKTQFVGSLIKDYNILDFCFLVIKNLYDKNKPLMVRLLFIYSVYKRKLNRIKNFLTCLNKIVNLKV